IVSVSPAFASPATRTVSSPRARTITARVTFAEIACAPGDGTKETLTTAPPASEGREKSATPTDESFAKNSTVPLTVSAPDFVMTVERITVSPSVVREVESHTGFDTNDTSCALAKQTAQNATP